MNKEIISMIYKIEDKLNIEKSWIDIANTVYKNSLENELQTGLVLNVICDINTEIFNDFEELIKTIGTDY